MSFNTFELLTVKKRPDDGAISQESNLNKVMIVLSADEDKDLRENLLPKIMKAVDIDLTKEVIMINAHQQGINIMGLISDQNIEIVIVFGVRPTDLSLNLSGSLYKINNVNGIEFLFSDDLKTISTNQDRKMALWTKLQSLFPN